MTYEEILQKIKDLEAIKMDVKKLSDIASEGFTKRIIEQITLEQVNLQNEVLNMQQPVFHIMHFTQDELRELHECISFSVRKGRLSPDTDKIMYRIIETIYAPPTTKINYSAGTE